MLRRFLLHDSPAESTDTFVDRIMRQFVAEHPTDDYARKSFPWDVRRLARSIEWLAAPIATSSQILELGGYSIASHVLEQRFPRAIFVRDGTDLRRPLPHPSSSFDLVIAMEVIEHVADLEYAHATTLSGVRHCLSEIHRLLRPGGLLFLTTPNATSLLILDRALHGQPPWLYPYHFREFTPRELQLLLEHSLLHVRQLTTEWVWSVEHDIPLARLLAHSGYPTVARGDDIFLLAEKTDTPPVPSAPLDLPL